MRGLLKKIGASVGAFALTFAFAAPVLAANTLNCSPNSVQGTETFNCEVTDCISGNVRLYDGTSCTGTNILSTTCGGGTGSFIGMTETATTTYSVLADSLCGNDDIVTWSAAPTLTTMADVFEIADVESKTTSVLQTVGVFVLAVFGILLIVGIAMSLIKKAHRTILIEMGKTPAEIREMHRAEMAQRKAERIARRGKDRFW